VLGQQESAPGGNDYGQREALASPLTKISAVPPTSSDRASDELVSLARQIRETVAVLDRATNPGNLKAALHRPDQLTQVESDLRQAQEHLTCLLGPSPVRDSATSAPRVPASNLLNETERSDPFAASRESAAPKGVEGQKQSDTHQPTLRAGGYIFSASPTGNKAIAYDPVSRAMKSVQLNATKEHPIQVTPISGNHVQHVALHLHGSNITRIAVFELKSSRWLPTDLAKPVKGEVGPKYIGHSGSAYDLGRHLYTFNADSGTWDHLDIGAISDEVDDESAGKSSAAGRADK
jgi:hypothetical protein